MMTTSAPRRVVIDVFPESPFRHRGRDAVACIDVMLATTTLVTAAAQGRAAGVAAGPEDVAARMARFPDALLAGAAEGAAVRFEMPDSPALLAGRTGDCRPLLLVSPPGTELIANAAQHRSVHLACFRNIAATAAALASYHRVALLSAGWREEFSCEDQMAAAWIAERLLDAGFEAEDRRTAQIVRRWAGIAPDLAGWGNSAAVLRAAGRAQDVDFVIGHLNDVDSPCVYEDGEVRLERVAMQPASAGTGRGGRER